MKRQGGWILGVLAIFLLALAPFLAHYLHSREEIGPRNPETIEAHWLPRSADYLRPSGSSLLYRALAVVESDGTTRQGLNPGWGTAFLALFGLLSTAQESRLSRRVLCTLALLTLSIGTYSIWKLGFHLLPGADAIRAVGRVRLVELYPWAIGVTIGAVWLARRSKALAALVLIWVTAEQLRASGSSDWRGRLEACSRLAERLPADCQSLLYSPFLETEEAGRRARILAQVDGMWIGMAAGVPTLNGHSGGVPKGWEFRNPWIRSAADEDRLRSALGEYRSRHDLERICWIRARPPGGEREGFDLADLQQIGDPVPESAKEILSP